MPPFSVVTTTSCETLATFDNVTLPNSKCTLSTLENDEILVQLGTIDATSSSTPPTFSTKQG